ncbi:MAG: hypothetical protein AAB865_01375 [Patescibacteria group bacterium]
MADQKSYLMKGAHFGEETSDGMNHATSVLFPLEGQEGFVFGVISAMGAKDGFEVVAAIMQNHLERLASTVERGTNLTHRFEQLLQAINEDIGAAYDDGQFSLPIADASSVIGIANKETVVVSGFGNLLAQFMHKSEKEHFDIYDLARGMRVEDEAPTWKKPYLTVLDGDLKSGDVLYIGTRISRHDMTGATLNEIITTLPPTSAVSRIRQYLPIETVFSAVVIRTERTDEPTLVSEGTAEASLEKFDNTKSTTDRFLSDQKPEVKSIAMKLWQLIFPKRGSAERKRAAKRGARFVWRLVLTFLTVTARILLGLLEALWKGARHVATHPKDILRSASKVRSAVDRNIRTGIQRFNLLPQMSKYILLVLLLIGFLFAGGIIFVHRQQVNAAERKAYEYNITNIEKKIENADASLIYGNEDQARTQLNEAWQLVSQLSTEPEARKQKADELKTTIEAKRNQLRHMLTVEATQVADASGLTDASLSAVVPIGSSFYGVTDKGDVYTIDTANGTLQQVEVTKGDVGGPEATTSSDAAIYWLDNGLTRFLPDTKEVAPLSVSRTGVDLVYYGAKMYILSPESGQVYRHQRTAAGFDGGSAWITSGVSSLVDATSLTIDGYVWILKADGTVLRYGAGKETDWRLGIVEPALLNTKDIWTDETSKFLYVLDPNEKRIVVFNKETGALITQYTNEAFADLKSMTIDETNKKITVLAGSKVYQFESKN